MPDSRLLLRLLFLPLVLVAMLSLWQATGAEEPRAVSLVYFRGESLDNAALLQWQTGTEIDTAGFKLLRADSTAGPFTYLSDIGIVAATGSAAVGDTYEATDEDASNGETYWYKLVEITFENSESELATIELAIAPTPTPEPVGQATSSTSGTAIPTSTSAPTNTPASPATATQSSGNSITATPSRTPLPTNTPAPTQSQPVGGTLPATQTQSAVTTVVVTLGSDRPEASAGKVTAAAGEAIAQAAGPTSTAQVTDEPGSYPGPAETTVVTVTVESAYPAENSVGAGSATAYPGGVSPSTVGNRTVGSEAEETEAQGVQNDGRIGRLLLWLGFIAALLIFIGGVFFAILLSTRNRFKDGS